MITLLWQIGLAIFGLWFLNGVKNACLKPRVAYVTHSVIPHKGTLITIKRQELFFPWRNLQETWLIDIKYKSYYSDNGIMYGVAVREGDGRRITAEKSWLPSRLKGLIEIQEAREAETKALLKDN